MPKLMAAAIGRSLRQRLGAGEWRDRGRLPDERSLAVEYQVARNTLRRAIDGLAADGLVSREVGRGTFLHQAKSSLDDLGAESAGGILTALRGVAGTSPADMMAVRLIVEPQAAALAAANASVGDLRAVAAAHDAVCTATDVQEFEAADATLHRRIFAGTRNELLGALHDLLCLIRGQAPWLELKRRSFTPARCAIYHAEHASIVDALLRRDGEAAAAAMRTHLETVGRNLFGRTT